MRLGILILVLCTICHAQTGTINGVVYDKDTGEAMPGVNIALENTLMGAATDIDGNFKIVMIPVGTYTLSASFIGYHKSTQQAVQVTQDDTIRLEMHLAIDPEFGKSEPEPHREWFFTTRRSGMGPYDSYTLSASRSLSFAEADILELENSSLTKGQIISSRGTYAEDQLYLLDGIQLNDPLTSRLSFRVPTLFTNYTSAFLNEQRLQYSGVRGSVFESYLYPDENRIKLRAVSSEPADDYGYNDVSGLISLYPHNRRNTTSLIIGGSWLDLADDAPSASGLNIPTANISSNSLPGINSRLANWLVQGRFYLADLHTEILHLGMDRRARRFISSYAKSNAEHHPLTENTDYITSLKSTFARSNWWYADLQVAYRQTRSATGDGVWFDDLEAYGDVDRNAEIGVTIPGQGQRLGFDSLGVYTLNGRVFDSFQKSRSNTLSGRLTYTASTSAVQYINAGIDFERHQLSYYEIEPVFLALATPEDRDRIYESQVGRFYGYDLFGDEISSSRIRRVPDPAVDDIFLEESSPRTPTQIGAFIDYHKDFGHTTVEAGLRYDYFSPSHRRIRNRGHFFEAGATNFRLEEEDFEDAPTRQYVSPQVTLRYRKGWSMFQLNMQLAHQRPPLMFYYDSWNNLEGEFGSDRDDLLHTGHIEFVQSQKIDLLYTRAFPNVGLLMRANLFFNHANNPLITFTRRSTTGFSQRYFYTGVGNAGNGSTTRGATISLIYEKEYFGMRASYNVLHRPGAGKSKFITTIDFQNNTTLGPAEQGNPKFPQSMVLYGYTNLESAPFVKDNPILNVIGKDLSAGIKLRYLKGYNYHVNTQYERQQESDYFLPRRSLNFGSFLQLDLHLSKKIEIAKTSVQPFLTIENLLDRENFFIGHVYTGEPDVTGLENIDNDNLPNIDLRRSDLASFAAFPDNYARPRMIRLGLSVDY